MQLFILCAAGAYFLYAIAAILDKHIVTNTPLKPLAYAFYSGFFQVIYALALPVMFLLLPLFDAWMPGVGQMVRALQLPALDVVLLGLFDGVLAVWALLSLYRATAADEISRISPVIGALVPIFTFLLSYLLLGEALSLEQLAAFVFLVLGGFLMSAHLSRERFRCIKGLPDVLLAGFLYAVYYVIMEYLFARAGFVEIFLIIQLGGFVGGILLLLSADNRKEIFKRSKRPQDGKKPNRGGALAFFANKGCSALASVLIYYAISISSATLVNSMQAVQYAFVFVFALVLSRKSPQLLKEEGGQRVLLQKGVALVLTALGIGLIN